MSNSLRRGLSPIGVDLGRRWIKIAQIDRRGDRERAWAIGRVPRTSEAILPDAEELDGLRAALDRLGFVRRPMALALPDELVSRDLVEVPPIESGAPVAALAEQEVARIRSWEPGTFDVGWWPLPPSRRDRDATAVYACAARRETTESILDRFEHAGFEIVRMDVPDCAIARACRDLVDDERGRIDVIVDPGWSAARIVVCRDGTIVYRRTIEEAGLAPMADAVASILEVARDLALTILERRVGVSPEDVALVRPTLQRHRHRLRNEIESATGYVHHRHPESSLGGILVCGDAGLAAALDGAGGLRAAEVGVDEMLSEGAAQGGRSDEAVAIGMARSAA